MTKIHFGWQKHMDIWTPTISQGRSLRSTFPRIPTHLKPWPYAYTVCMYAQPILCCHWQATSCENKCSLGGSPLPLTQMFSAEEVMGDDLLRALNTRLDKCNDIQMSRIILCLWGALSNWILIKYWVRETLYLIIKAAPLLPSSGEPAVCSTEWALWIREGCRECVYTEHKSMSRVLVNWCKVPVEGETCIQLSYLTLYLLLIYIKILYLV